MCRQPGSGTFGDSKYRRRTERCDSCLPYWRRHTRTKPCGARSSIQGSNMMHERLGPSHRLPVQVSGASERARLDSIWPRVEPAFGVVLFADIVGFTALSEEIEPVE